MISATQDPIHVHVDSELEELIPLFLRRRREDVDRLRSAHASGDVVTISRIGHAMKGTGGGYGFDELSALGARLELAGRNEDLDGALELIEILDTYLERVRVVFV